MSRVLAVGDIHTKSWIIDKVETLVNRFDKVVFIGDYADNWGAGIEETIITWSRMYELQRDYPDKVIPLIGNHDYAYTMSTPPNSSGYDPLIKMVLSNPEYKHLEGWLKSLMISIVIDDVVYSHAGMTESWVKTGSDDSDRLWRGDSPLWARPVSLGGSYNYCNSKQVFGHTPVKTCTEVHPGIWNIDTFSQYRDGQFIGDGTVLEVVDGESFTALYL